MRATLFSLMVLAGLTFLLGCEKENLVIPQKNVQQPAWQITDDMAALFSAEERKEIEASYQEALDHYRGEKIVLPMMVKMDVRLSYSMNRDQNEGKDEIDVAITGQGAWVQAFRLRYFEVQYKPDANGFWKGEGWMKKDMSISHEEPALFFTSRKGNECFYDRSAGYVMEGILEFTGGTYEFQYASGEALRKVFVDHDDMSRGEAILYGFLVLPATPEALVEAETGFSAP